MVKAETLECKMCGFKASDKHSLGLHISQKHDSKYYYNTFIEPNISHKCPFCDDELKFKTISKGYCKTCGSSECIDKLKLSISSSDIVKEKRKITYENKYGHGITNPSQAIEVKNKKKETFSRNYKDDLTKKQELIARTKKTLLDRYGDENYNNRQKMKQTKFEHYGDENYTNRAKAAETCIERYGVSNYTQTKEYHHKKKHKFTYNGVGFDSSDEMKLYKFCYENCIACIPSPCSFEYTDSLGNEHKYIPDFLIDGRLYEIKGDHLWKDGHIWMPYRNTLDEAKLKAIDARDLAKTQCMRDNNVTVILSSKLNSFINKLI